MPSTIEAAVSIPRKVWTRDEAHALVDLGFPNAERFELIEGDLINRMGKKHLHILWQNLIHEWLRVVFSSEFVQVESPIDVAIDDNHHNEPEPDLLVTTRSIRDYDSIPAPADLKLVVEVSDTTLQFDLKVKAPLYARAKIAEYWVVDVIGKRLIVHRNPIDGVYRDIVTYTSSQEVALLAAPDARFCLDRL